jgi:hypothetical protein
MKTENLSSDFKSHETEVIAGLKVKLKVSGT